MRAFDRLVRRLALLGVATAALVLLTSLVLVVYSVVMRYFLDHPAPWVDELVGYLLVACVMLASADALLEGEHLGVDLLTERLAARGRRLALLFGLVAVGSSALLLTVEGWDMVEFSRMVGLRSNGYMAVPMWVPQLLVPVGSVVMLLAAVVAFAAAARGGAAPPDTPPHGPTGIE
jgi:C4-dicarboxylate transporter DctQ subunit